ncbi:hypothetical protein M427DRAFT_58555 [Gonapodya prolifera JEL478]|uniref:Uncharacterized protein n=1 Tax=Gonapodya prolifera (strain JEL478) TaxID=1344416 RepID=A0A139A9Y9_GONPJ|nr:hypothetical protein M427DRAFT_58555 [Gonapodya prolifera JEL478]|eukprot:KXS13499.1 hypothetical protein M427DRAFT_58555 [Gonapodya prolifera JEL478]
MTAQIRISAIAQRLRAGTKSGLSAVTNPNLTHGHGRSCHPHHMHSTIAASKAIRGKNLWFIGASALCLLVAPTVVAALEYLTENEAGSDFETQQNAGSSLDLRDSLLFRILNTFFPRTGLIHCAPAPTKHHPRSPVTPCTSAAVPISALALLRQVQDVFEEGFRRDINANTTDAKNVGRWEGGAKGHPPDLRTLGTLELPATFTNQLDYYYKESCLMSVRVPLPPSMDPVCLYPVRCSIDIPLFPVLSESEEKRVGESGQRKDVVGRCRAEGECELGCARVKLTKVEFRLFTDNEDLVWVWGK